MIVNLTIIFVTKKIILMDYIFKKKSLMNYLHGKNIIIKKNCTNMLRKKIINI